MTKYFFGTFIPAEISMAYQYTHGISGYLYQLNEHQQAILHLLVPMNDPFYQTNGTYITK